MREAGKVIGIWKKKTEAVIELEDGETIFINSPKVSRAKIGEKVYHDAENNSFYFAYELPKEFEPKQVKEQRTGEEII